MKTLLSSTVVAAIFAAVVTTSNAQTTLGSAANFDIFVMTGGKIDLKDSNQLFGQVGYSNKVDAKKNEKTQNFDGAVYVHTGANFTAGKDFNPSGGIFTSGFDGVLDQANRDVTDYAAYLGGLGNDSSFSGTYSSDFSFSSNKSLSVIDFKKVDASGRNFSFTGRAGQMDTIIIRIDEEFKFEGGSVNLTNIDAKNVIWYLDSDKKFELHKGGGTFAGTIVAPNGAITLGEVDFTGAVYGKELKLGSGFDFTGNTVPEPSSSLLVLIGGAGGLLLIRRRKH